MLKKAFSLFLFLGISYCSFGQLPAGLSISGYTDAYLAYYTDSVGSGNYQKFPTYAPRSNSIGLNIAQLSLNYKKANVRALVTLHAGDIPNVAWSSKYQMIQEANAGVQLHKKIWLDAGFFRTHIGAEGLYPKENITSSLAVTTLYEPYYQAGFKLSYQITSKLEGRLYLLNGFNLLEDNNKKKSVGMLFTYVFNDACNVVYANYLGDDTPDSMNVAHTRFFNNLVLYYDKGKYRLTVGIDFIRQEHASFLTNAHAGTGYGALIAGRYTIKPKWNIYTRAEAFNDKDGFLAGPILNINGALTQTHIMGGTVGLEYKPRETAFVRLEGRVLKSYNDVKPFYWDSEYRDRRYEAIFSLGVWF